MWGSFRFKNINGSTRSLPTHYKDTVSSNHISKLFNKACIYDPSVRPFNDKKNDDDQYVLMSNLCVKRKSLSLESICASDSSQVKYYKCT